MGHLSRLCSAFGRFTCCFCPFGEPVFGCMGLAVGGGDPLASFLAFSRVYFVNGLFSHFCLWRVAPFVAPSVFSASFNCCAQARTNSGRQLEICAVPRWTQARVGSGTRPHDDVTPFRSCTLLTHCVAQSFVFVCPPSLCVPCSHFPVFARVDFGSSRWGLPPPFFALFLSGRPVFFGGRFVFCARLAGVAARSGFPPPVSFAVLVLSLFAPPYPGRVFCVCPFGEFSGC